MARRPKEAKLVINARLRAYVQERLDGTVQLPDGRVIDGPIVPAWAGRNKPHRQDRKWSTAWSPEQIARRLPVDFPDGESMRISHEAIYQSLFIEGMARSSANSSVNNAFTPEKTQRAVELYLAGMTLAEATDSNTRSIARELEARRIPRRKRSQRLGPAAWLGRIAASVVPARMVGLCPPRRARCSSGS